MPVLRPIAVALCCALGCAPLAAQTGGTRISDGAVRIGLILDLSGPYSDVTGEGSIAAARMAIEDFGGKVGGQPIELVFADHQNKADVAANKAR